jgi:hypothetical protein
LAAKGHFPWLLFQTRYQPICFARRVAACVHVFNLVRDGIDNSDTLAALQKWLRCLAAFGGQLNARHIIVNGKHSPAGNRRTSSTLSPTASAAAKPQWQAS